MTTTAPPLADLGLLRTAMLGLARALMGGNGILLEYGTARLFTDAEAIYSYEGSNEINSRIAGRGRTGIGAFV